MPNYSMQDPEYWQVPEERRGSAASLQDVRLSYFLLGQDLPETPRVLIMDMDPGFVIPRHAHGCERFEVIVRGSLYVGDDVFHPGDVLTAHADELYGPKVAGPEGCLTAEVFAEQGSSAPAYELDDGTTVYAKPSPGAPWPPENIAQRDWIEERRREALAGAAAQRA